jgi:hypothetical protein
MKEPNIYSPEFIPFYPAIVRKFELSYLEGLIYGFVRFYTSSTKNYFYFTNDQIGALLSRNPKKIVSEKQISISIKHLLEKGLCKASYFPKPEGGKTRFLRADITKR